MMKKMHLGMPIIVLVYETASLCSNLVMEGFQSYSELFEVLREERESLVVTPEVLPVMWATVKTNNNKKQKQKKLPLIPDQFNVRKCKSCFLRPLLGLAS